MSNRKAAPPVNSLFFILIGSMCLTGVASAQSIKPSEDEKERLKACERQICSAALTKTREGDVSCSLQKTWSKSSIENGVRTKKITWTFGDAQCGLDVAIPNADIVDAMTSANHTVELPSHDVLCNLERENEITEVKLKVAPKIEFADGKAKKAWLNVSDIEAPTIIKGAIWTVAKIEDNIGLFHSEAIAEINEFFEQKCPKRYPEFVQK